MRRIEHSVVVGALRQQALSRSAGFRGILVGEERDIRPHELDRMVNNVAHEHRAGSAALGVDDDAAGRVAGRVLEPDAILDLAMHAGAAVHDIGESGLDHRQHRVGIGLSIVRFVRLPAKKFKILAAEHVSGVRKRRDPAPILQTSIPSDMVRVQVRAQHEVNIGRIAACTGEVLQPLCL